MQSLLPISLLLLLHGASSFQPVSISERSNSLLREPITYLQSTSGEARGEDDEAEDEDFEILFGEEEEEPDLDVTEKAWRYAKKPLLSIGAKGATGSHGNSLRQLLDSHTVVKVKVNTNKFGTLENAFNDIKSLAEEAGAPEGIEMLQARDKDKVILFAMPGTTERLESGDFPPKKDPKKEDSPPLSD